jgi:uncharacterized protein YhbP (UPF0306 family)
MDMNQLVARVRKVILDNRYLTMATCEKDSVWIAPLAYYVEPDYSFIYFTSKESRHQTHIEKNPIVACSIYNSSLPSDTVDGIQFSAKVSQVPANELLSVLPKYFLQSFPIEEIRKKWYRPITDFEGLKVQRFYRITPLDMFTIDFESIKVDKRIEVDLDLLKQIPIKK